MDGTIRTTVRRRLIISLTELMVFALVGLVYVTLALPSVGSILFYLLEFVYILGGPIGLVTSSQYFSLSAMLTIAVLGVVSAASWGLLLIGRIDLCTRLLFLPVLVWLVIGVHILRVIVVYSI